VCKKKPDASRVSFLCGLRMEVGWLCSIKTMRATKLRGEVALREIRSGMATMSLSCIRPAFFRSVALFLLPAISVHAAAPVTAGNAVKVTDCSFGEVYASSVAACSFTLENAGSKPVSLSVTPLNPGNTVEPASLNLPPGSSAKVAARATSSVIANRGSSPFVNGSIVFSTRDRRFWSFPHSLPAKCTTTRLQAPVW